MPWYLKRCANKRRHATRDEAVSAKKRLQRGGGGNAWLKVYKCPNCQGFHVGRARGRR